MSSLWLPAILKDSILGNTDWRVSWKYTIELFHLFCLLRFSGQVIGLLSRAVVFSQWVEPLLLAMDSYRAAVFVLHHQKAFFIESTVAMLPTYLCMLADKSRKGESWGHLVLEKIPPWLSPYLSFIMLHLLACVFCSELFWTAVHCLLTVEPVMSS